MGAVATGAVPGAGSGLGGGIGAGAGVTTGVGWPAAVGTQFLGSGTFVMVALY